MKKVLVTMLILTAMVMPLFANGQSEKTNSKQEKLVVWSWGSDNEKKAKEDSVAIFQANHPEIKVEHSVIPTANHAWDQKMLAAFASGNGPDVIQMSPDYYGLYSKFYEDLAPYLAKENIDLENDITPTIFDIYYNNEGMLEGLPFFDNVFALAYNKDLFDQFGVDYPTAQWTWDDLEVAAKKFASGKGANAIYGMVNHWINPSLALISKGGKPYSDDLKTCLLNDEKVAEGLNLFSRLTTSKAMPNDSSANSLPKEQLFVSGHAAMYPLAGFETSFIAEEIGENFDWDIVTMPQVEKGSATNILLSVGYSILANSEHKDAAWTFVKEVCYEDEDIAKIASKIGIPANKKIANTTFKNLTFGPVNNEAYIDGFANSVTRLNIWGGAFSAAGDQWYQIWQEVTLAGSTGEEALEKYYPLLEQSFNEAVNSK